MKTRVVLQRMHSAVAAHMGHFRTSTKLWAAFGLLLVLTGLASVYALVQLNQLGRTLVDLTTVQQHKVNLANEWKALSLSNALRMTATAVTGNAALLELFSKDYGSTAKREAEVSAELSAMPMTEKERELFEPVKQSRQQMAETEKLMRELAQQDKSSDVLGVFDVQYQPALNQMRFQMSEFVELQQMLQRDRVERAQAAQITANVLTGTLAAAVLVAGLICAWSITRSIQKPLVQAVEHAHSVAAGDLTRVVDNERRDEFGALSSALNEMTRSLSTLVTQVQTAADEIGGASEDVARGNSDLSSRTEQQAASLEETAAAVEQLAATVQQNAGSTEKATEAARNASGVAQRGGDEVARVVQTMENISVSSKRIADITGVIDGIAFQTNILALNAAVEAARAGEQGRGFSVVASEVRALAQRSAVAAKEIKQLIESSVEQVNGGQVLVVQAGKTMVDVVASVNHVADLIYGIGVATKEQAQGVNNINEAVGELDLMTQQNAALVEQSTAAAESLRDQVTQLRSSVATFKT
jgi:methyl-accepting chemotaxis protein